MDYQLSHFAYLARYNRGANKALVGHLSALPLPELSKPRGSHFVSIQGLLDHVITCDINWLRRFRELFAGDEALSRPRLAPAGHAWKSFEFPVFADYVRERAVVDAIFEDWIAGVESSRLGEVLVYKDSHGSPKRYLASEALDHVFNHQTHHRGQVSQILDELRVEHDYSNLLDAAASLEGPE